MITGKIKIGVIGSNKLISCALKVANHQEKEIEVALSGLDEAVPIGQRMEKDGIEVIVTRRGTAYLLRKVLTIPILSIPTTYHELLSTAKEAAALGRRVLLTAFIDKPKDIHVLEKIFKIKILTISFMDAKSLEKAIIWGKSKGCKVIIGGGVAIKIAEKHGLKGVELSISEEAMASILEDAKSVALSRGEEQEKALMYRAIIDSVSEGIIAIDPNGCIITMNKAAKNFFNTPADSALGKPIAEFIPNAPLLKVMKRQIPLLNQVERINQDQFVVNHHPILDGQKTIGGISTLKDISNVMEAENEVRRSFAKRLVSKYTIDDFIYRSRVMGEVIEKVRKFAPVDSTVLLCGETGTGKEILSHSIHSLGKRCKGPFVSINCAALPEQLLESELFGYEEGAFTGSRRGGKTGLFELAHRGTIFLDEIGATFLNVQSRLLRVLQEKEIMRIGGELLIPVDVRVIAATNQDLSRKVQTGQFREDLFFRLNTLTIFIPPLRERMDDLPLLIAELSKRTARRYGLMPIVIPIDYIQKLMLYPWPGNVRQLSNFIERLVLLSGNTFKPEVFEELQRELISYSGKQGFNPTPPAMNAVSSYIRTKARDAEAKIIIQALEQANFNKSEAAKKLGISRTTIWRKLKEIECHSPISPIEGLAPIKAPVSSREGDSLPIV